jgi:hypothetical protein
VRPNSILVIDGVEYTVIRESTIGMILREQDQYLISFTKPGETEQRVFIASEIAYQEMVEKARSQQND